MCCHSNHELRNTLATSKRQLPIIEAINWVYVTLGYRMS